MANKRTPAKGPVKPARRRTANRAEKSNPDPTGSNVVPISRKRSTATSQTKRPQGGRGESPTSDRRVRVLERRNMALNLRRAGMTYPQIAEQIAPGFPELKAYTKADAYNDVKALLDEMAIDDPIAFIQEDLDTLRAAQTVAYRKMTSRSVSDKTNLEGARVLLSVLDRRAKYYGWDAPLRLANADGSPLTFSHHDDPDAVYSAAIEALDDILPHVDLPELGT